MEKTWQLLVAGLVLAGSLISPGYATDASSSSGPARTHAAGARRGSGFGFAALLERTVNLTPEQSDAVRGLLAEQRKQSQDLRTQTDTKIRGLLNPDQQKKFDAFLAEQKTRRAGNRSNAA